MPRRAPTGPATPASTAHFVYIVRCADGTFYTGYATDPEARARIHNLGRGARYTSGRRPVVLVHIEACESRGAALRREHAIKQLARAEKAALCRPRRRRRTPGTPPAPSASTKNPPA